MSRIVNGVVISKHPNQVLGEIEDLKGQHFGHLKDNQLTEYVQWIIEGC